jgi:hypothetical protein
MKFPKHLAPERLGDKRLGPSGPLRREGAQRAGGLPPRFPCPLCRAILSLEHGQAHGF